MKIVSAVLCGMFVFMSTAKGQESGEPRLGLAAARAHCSTCHAIGKGEQFSPHPIAPTFQRLADTPGVTAIALNHLMNSAHKTMPLIVLPPDEHWHLIAYVLSLRSNSAAPSQ